MWHWQTVTLTDQCSLFTTSQRRWLAVVSVITRKPSWRKGKRATAVRVWRPLAKKSTANFQLMVNSNQWRRDGVWGGTIAPGRQRRGGAAPGDGANFLWWFCCNINYVVTRKCAVDYYTTANRRSDSVGGATVSPSRQSIFYCAVDQQMCSCKIKLCSCKTRFVQL